ncbi:MAG: OadG family protein [Firmicutes bacterium]|nr:OadG family protein [Bacillota bacterium]MBQ2217448.1 OadG family protein [Bacillota bacterium]
MSIGTGAVYSLLGICVVFAALALLMAVVVILYRVTTPKASAQVPAAEPQTEEIAEYGIPEAPGSAGGIKLYNTDPRDAAMVMAIVADTLGKPLNELRFLSIKRIDEEAGGGNEI